jgi:hypothetical protein
MRTIFLAAIGAAVALTLAAPAFATGGHGTHKAPRTCKLVVSKGGKSITIKCTSSTVSHPCKTTPAKCKPSKPTPPNGNGNGNGSTPQPPVVVQVNRTGYCFQTSSHGWTYINLVAGDVLEAGHYWFDLYVSKATATVDGKVVTFAGWEDWRADGGIVEAPFVAGVGQTCDNPYVK